MPERETRPTRPAANTCAGMIPTLASPGESAPGQFGPEQRHPARPQVAVDAQHVVGRDALGDADDGLDAGVGGLVDGVGREARRHEHHRGVGAVLATASATVSKTGMPSTSCPPLPGVTPATTFVP